MASDHDEEKNVPTTDTDDESPTVDDPSQASFLADAGAGGPASASAAQATVSAAESRGYRVLARRYRPKNFAELVGHEVMVRTLTNAFSSGRIAHAFILTGVRGIGKTTTARILAMGLNCVGPDGRGGRTIDPCGVCENCVAIAEDRHVDVMEMDAASRTGVDDIREIIEGVRYRPVVGREKVYIIDEVHMLSRNAFNALLKTLEEPPEHVRFIFATTEIRKLPLTILSRCQRFDLKRVEADRLMAYLDEVATAEGARVRPEALRVLARAADGSLRDGLSLLDQAIAHGADEIAESQIRDMLGLADAGQVYDLFQAVMGGRVGEALDQLDAAYAAGVDPTVLIRDMLELTHWLTRLKVTPSVADGAAVSEIERTRGGELAAALSIPVLSRTWQFLLKGLEDLRTAPSPLQAAEMVLVRLAHVADLPPPGDLIRELQDRPRSDTAPSTPLPTRDAAASAPAPSAGPAGGASVDEPAKPVTDAASAPAKARRETSPARAVATDPTDFRAVVELFEARREVQIRNHLYHNVQLVRFEPGRLEISLDDHAPPDLPGQVLKHLRAWCGAHWQVTVAEPTDASMTLAEQDRAAERARLSTAREHPLVRAALETFPGARIERVKPLGGAGVEHDPLPAEPETGDED